MDKHVQVCLHRCSGHSTRSLGAKRGGGGQSRVVHFFIPLDMMAQTKLQMHTSLPKLNTDRLMMNSKRAKHKENCSSMVQKMEVTII